MKTSLCLLLAAPFATLSLATASQQQQPTIVQTPALWQHRQLKGKKPTAKENKEKGRAPDDDGDAIDAKSKGKDKKIANGDLTIDVKGKSGKFSIERQNLGKGKKKSTVSVNVDSVTEVDSKGKVVGKTGKVKHSIKSLANQDFTFTVAKEDVVAGANATAKATRVTFDATLDTGSNLVIETLLISSKGTVGTDTETWTVLPGDLKWNIALSNWTWCNPCKEGDGAFVDVDLEIKGSKKEPKAREKGKKMHDDKDEEGKKKRRLKSHVKADQKPKKNKGFDLGDGAILELSDQILVDGAWSSMPDGYPKYTAKGSKQIYTFRFPKFKDTAFYDPIVGFSSTEADEEDADKDDANDGGTSLLSSGMVFVLSSFAMFGLFF